MFVLSVLDPKNGIHETTEYGKQRRTLFVANSESGMQALDNANRPSSDPDFEVYKKHHDRPAKKSLVKKRSK